MYTYFEGDNRSEELASEVTKPPEIRICIKLELIECLTLLKIREGGLASGLEGVLNMKSETPVLNQKWQWVYP